MELLLQIACFACWVVTNSYLVHTYGFPVLLPMAISQFLAMTFSVIRDDARGSR